MKRKNNKKIKVNLLSLIPIIFIVFFIVSLSVDYNKINKEAKPVFAFHTKTYEDGTIKYVGLFYTVYKITISEAERTDSSWEIVPWFTNIERINDESKL